MWEPSSPTRYQISAPCIRRQSPNHGTTREVSLLGNFNYQKLLCNCFQLFFPPQLGQVACGILVPQN